MPAARFVAFLSDYGLTDPFVGLCHAAVLCVAPGARVVDLTHAISAQSVLEGAVVLADCVAWLPSDAVVLAVVDPGVGTARLGVAVQAERGRLLVGPDNGLLVPAAEQEGGVAAAWALPAATGPARTFDGRDVFAPAAGRLAAGSPPGLLGTPLDPDDLVRVEVPACEVVADRVQAPVVRTDHFGNLLLAAVSTALEDAGLVAGIQVRVTAGGRSHEATVARTFADVAPGALAVLPDAFGRLQVAANQGSAASHFAAGPDTEVTITRLPPSAGLG